MLLARSAAAARHLHPLIPYPVTVGFTAGIAVIIFASQLHDLLGLQLAVPNRPPSCPSCRRCAMRCRHASTGTMTIAVTVASIVLVRG